MTRSLLLGTLTLGLLLGTSTHAAEPEGRGVLGFTMKDIDGKPVDLAKYKGDVVLVVNVASKCGLTPQYKELETAFDTYKDRGFTILAFPANEFGNQEPGSNAEIKSFCQANYDVSFPVFSKIVVDGEGIHPLYQFLTNTATDPKYAGPIRWNFTKFLLDRNGKIIARFEPKVTPNAPEVTQAIEAALAAPKP